MFFQIGIQLGIALSYLSLLTASPAAHVLVPRETRATNPSYSTAFLGDDGSRRPGARLYNDLTLLTDGGGHRRIGKIQIWCGDWVYGMIPWYYDTLGVASTSRHWQYAKNLHGEYKELILGQDEYITAITSNVCTYDSGTKLTYLELITSGNNAHAKQHLYCGEQSPVNSKSRTFPPA